MAGFSLLLDRFIGARFVSLVWEGGRERESVCVCRERTKGRWAANRQQSVIGYHYTVIFGLCPESVSAVAKKNDRKTIVVHAQVDAAQLYRSAIVTRCTE